MKITISGKPGAGKSTIGKLVAERLRYSFYDIGQIRRNMAKDLGVNIHDLNKIGEKESFTDLEPDKYAEKVGKNEDNFVMVGRMSFYFVPDSFKIFLDVDKKVAAERIFNNHRNDENYKDINDAINYLNIREESDAKRFKKYYGIDIFDLSHYDLVIDTTNLKPNEIVEIILKELNKLNRGSS